MGTLTLSDQFLPNPGLAEDLGPAVLVFLVFCWMWLQLSFPGANCLA